MKEKILARLKEKFPGVNLTKARKDAIAARLLPKITEESEIDQKLDEANELMDFAEIAKADDKVRTLEEKVKSLTPPTPAPTPDPSPTPEPTPTPTPAPSNSDDLKKLIAEAVSAAVTPIAQELNTFKAGKAAETMTQAFKTGLTGLNPILAESYLDNFDPSKFKTEDELTAHIEVVKTKIAASEQKLTDAGLGGTPRPYSPTGGAAGKEASKEEAESLLKKILPA